MTSFAERLVARSTGRLAGLPVLTLRPAARFEKETIVAPDRPAAQAETEWSAGTPGRRQNSAVAAGSSVSSPPRPSGRTPAISTETEADVETANATPSYDRPHSHVGDSRPPRSHAPALTQPSISAEDQATTPEPGPAVT